MASHADCSHGNSKAERAACRKGSTGNPATPAAPRKPRAPKAQPVPAPAPAPQPAPEPVEEAPARRGRFGRRR